MSIPAFGLGTFRLQGQVVIDSVSTGLELGYRVIDTAQIYENEADVGQAIADSGIPRDELFITSKIWIANFAEGQLIPSLKESLRKLQTDYLDLTQPKYPSSEVLYAQKPDLVVGGFATAFGTGVTSRTGLAGNGVGSYLLESACDGHSLDYFGHIRNDLFTLGALVHKQQRARALSDAMDADLASAQALTGKGKPLSVFYLDSEVNGLDSEGRMRE